MVVPLPLDIMPGPAGTQPGSIHGAVVSVNRAAAMPAINTVGAPDTMAKGRAGCGTGVGVGAAGWIGAWQWGALWMTLSPIRAAGCDMRVYPVNDARRLAVAKKLFRVVMKARKSYGRRLNE